MNLTTTHQAAATRMEAVEALTFLRRSGFIGGLQSVALGHLLRGEQQQFFFDKLRELAEQIKAMPKTYEQDGMGDQSVVTLHYFRGGMDWFITEKDCAPEQHQAYGLADLGDGGELGFVSLIEITGMGAELDFHFTPRTLVSIQAGRA